jgi:hypothetical protein
MVVLVMVVCCVLFIGSVAMAMSGAKDGSAPERRRGDPARLLALEFRGVVVSNEQVAHAFDAKYSCRVKIKCDDGANVVMTTSIFDQYKFPVGSRVVKRVGKSMPEPATDAEPTP